MQGIVDIADFGPDDGLVQCCPGMICQSRSQSTEKFNTATEPVSGLRLQPTRSVAAACPVLYPIPQQI